MNPFRQTLVGLLTVATLVMPAGCSPKFWRNQADRDAYLAITRTLDDPRIQVPRIDVTPDPSSRFFDPHPLDCTPLPPDDPTAHQYMHAVDGWKGYNGWHQQGQSLVIENPQWYANIGLDPTGYDETTGRYVGGGSIPKLTLVEAVNLAQIHGRSYQQQIEDVFTSALGVTAEEFEFTVRYLDTASRVPGVNVNTELNPGTGRADDVTQTSNFGISRLLPTGATLAVGLANSTMWLFAGGDGTRSVPTLSYELTQPLLAMGGRKIVLEALTQQQRSLLYSIRDLARFRREYFTDVVATQGGGYLGLLQQVQTIRNQVDNIDRLERQLDVLRAQASQKPGQPRASLPEVPAELGTKDALTVPDSLAEFVAYDTLTNELIWKRNQISDAEVEALLDLSDDPAFRVAVEEIARQLTDNVVTLDVLQLESQLANSLNRLRSQQRQLQDSLDSYKIFLGLPTDFPLGVDDRLLEPFQFIDARITQLDRDINAYVSDWALLDEDDPDLESSRAYLSGMRDLLRRVQQEGADLVRDDLERIKDLPLDRLEDSSRQRLKIDSIRDRRLYAGVIDRLQARAAELNRAEQRLNLSEELSKTAAATADPFAAETLAKQAAAIRAAVRNAFNETRFSLLQDAQSLAVIQIGVRTDFITVEPVDLTIEDAVRIGLENRLDLKNERAQVTDAWRVMERRKQLLRSNLDLTAEGELSGPADNGAFNFNKNQSSYRFGLEFDSPLDQIDERNAYRNAQIDYQQARRAYMLAEDNVKRDIRTAWRQLIVLVRNLETAKRAVRIAALQYDVAVEQAYAPATGGGQSAGVRGRNLLNALGDVLSSQNNLIGIFVDYETNRLTLARDMGTMSIGEDGIWNDPLYRRIAAGGTLLPDKASIEQGASNFQPELDSSKLGPGAGVMNLDLVPVAPKPVDRTAALPQFDRSQSNRPLLVPSLSPP